MFEMIWILFNKAPNVQVSDTYLPVGRQQAMTVAMQPVTKKY